MVTASPLYLINCTGNTPTLLFSSTVLLVTHIVSHFLHFPWMLWALSDSQSIFCSESLAYFVPLHLHGGLSPFFGCKEKSVEDSVNRTGWQMSSVKPINTGTQFNVTLAHFLLSERVSI